MSLIWATRGRTWGFRFLRAPGRQDPLEAYELAFSGVLDAPEAYRRRGNEVALRFSDPLGRQDDSGRIIPHEFVVFEPLANDIQSVADGLRHVWPLVADSYAQVWESREPPTVNG